MANLPGLPIPGQSFGRFDEITDLVEKASDLTLPDSVRCHFHVAMVTILHILECPLSVFLDS